MKVLAAVGIFGIMTIALAGVVLGAVFWKSNGILAQIGAAAIGGIAGLFLALHIVSVIEVIVSGLWGIFRRNPSKKEADKDE